MFEVFVLVFNCRYLGLELFYGDGELDTLGLYLFVNFNKAINRKLIHLELSSYLSSLFSELLALLV